MEVNENTCRPKLRSAIVSRIYGVRGYITSSIPPLFRSAPCCTFSASFCMACVILLFAVPVEKATSCQQARAQKVTEFTPQQWAHNRLSVVSLCDYFCLLTSLFPLLWCKFCNLLCACLLANGCFLHQHSKQKKSHTPYRKKQ